MSNCAQNIFCRRKVLSSEDSFPGFTISVPRDTHTIWNVVLNKDDEKEQEHHRWMSTSTITPPSLVTQFLILWIRIWLGSSNDHGSRNALTALGFYQTWSEKGIVQQIDLFFFTTIDSLIKEILVFERQWRHWREGNCWDCNLLDNRCVAASGYNANGLLTLMTPVVDEATVNSIWSKQRLFLIVGAWLPWY
jgi:hypothetical protein